MEDIKLCVRCHIPTNNGRTRCDKHHQAHLEYQRKAKNKAISIGKCRYCLANDKLPNKSMCNSCLIKHNTKGKILYDIKRKNCVQAYGGKCNCCGLANEKYLQLDHINNDGNIHRMKIFNGHKGCMYTWAKQNNYPSNLQLLCANCHQAKTSNRPCTPDDHKHFHYDS